MLDGRVVAGAGWLATEVGPSLADLYLGVLLRWAQLYPSEEPPLGGLQDWPAIRALCRRIEERPAMMRACVAEAIPVPRPLTEPRLPALPRSEVTDRENSAARPP